MKDYFYLASSLPPLEIGQPPLVHFEELMDAFKINLHEEDMRKVEVMRRYIDIVNLGAFFRGDELDPMGNIPADNMERAVLEGEGLPRYVCDFLEEYDSNEERAKHYPKLLVFFFKEEIASSEGFLHHYLRFERDWRLVMVGFRAKLLGKDVAVELQYEDPEDIIVAQILAQKDSPTYEPPVWFGRLKETFEENRDHPLKLHKAICEYRFAMMEHLSEREFFSMDRVLGYLAQLVIVEQWLKLDEQEGKAILDKMVKETV